MEKKRNLRGGVKKLLYLVLVFVLAVSLMGSSAVSAASTSPLYEGLGVSWDFEFLSEATPFEYYTTDFESIADLKETAHAVSRQVQTDGAVLLKNERVDDGSMALPICPSFSPLLSLYDVTAVDPIWGGSGSGIAAVTGGRSGGYSLVGNDPTGNAVTTNHPGNFEAVGKTGIFDSPSFPVATSRQSWRASFEDRGFEINEGLWNWYDRLPRNISAQPGRRGGSSSSGTAGQAADWTNNPSPGHMATFNISGAAWNEMPAAYRAMQADTAIFFLGRKGGEDFDRQMLSWDLGVPAGGNSTIDLGNQERSYLRLSTKERTVLDNLAYLRDTGVFTRLILVINSSNQPELDWLTLDNEFNFDAAMWIGGLGQDGIDGVVDLITGEQNFSGRLPFLFWNRHADNPVYANFGSYTWGTGVSNRTAEGGHGQFNRYVVYQEGMYMGYRYAETRYFDKVRDFGNAIDNGTWDGRDFCYNEVVAFPFGFGKSYSEFEYSDFSVRRIDKENQRLIRPREEFSSMRLDTVTWEASVTVTNVSNIPGREVVQVYLQRPYTEYDIEMGVQKPAVDLVGFTKTPLLDAGESYTAVIEVCERLFAAYDAHGAQTFVATGGDYYLSIGSGIFGSHAATNNILAYMGYTEASGKTFDGNPEMAWRISGASPDINSRHDFGTDTVSPNFIGLTRYSISDVTGQEITNLFDDADLNRFDAARGSGNAHDNKVTYISRSDWAGTTVFINPELREGAQTAQTVVARTPAMLALMNENRARVGTSPGEYPTFGDPDMLIHDLTLADLAVRRPDGSLVYGFDHPKWDLLVEQLTWNEHVFMLSDGFRRTMNINRIGKIRTNEVNGPVGFSPRYGDVAMHNMVRHHSFPTTGFVNFGLGEKDPRGVATLVGGQIQFQQYEHAKQGFANIGVFWAPDWHGEGEGAFIPRRDTDFHHDLYFSIYGRPMQQILDPDHTAYCTAFPSNPVLAATFDTELAWRVGEMIGEDALWAGFNGIYGTGINIIRAAHQGRAFEYYSECGILSGIMASAWSGGVQSKGTYVYNKHFVLNEQELSRYGISQFISEQALREIYLRAFEIPIRNDDARAIMGTLGRVGVEYGPAHRGLMTYWLRGEAGFSGITVTDWWMAHEGGSAARDGQGTGQGIMYNLNNDYYMRLTRTLLAGNDLPDGVISHIHLDEHRPEGEPMSPINSTRHHVQRQAIPRVHNAEIAWAMRESVKRILFTVAQSNAVNHLESYIRTVALPCAECGEEPCDCANILERLQAMEAERERINGLISQLQYETTYAELQAAITAIDTARASWDANPDNMNLTGINTTLLGTQRARLAELRPCNECGVNPCECTELARQQAMEAERERINGLIGALQQEATYNGLRSAITVIDADISSWNANPDTLNLTEINTTILEAQRERLVELRPNDGGGGGCGGASSGSFVLVLGIVPILALSKKRKDK